MPSYPNYGSSQNYVNPYAAQQFAPVMQGMSTMNNLGNQISSGFALANALSSANLQARAPYDASMQIAQMHEQGRNQRLASILPALLSAFGGGGGSGGFNTNYGASASYGQPQQQQAAAGPQGRVDPGILRGQLMKNELRARQQQNQQDHY